MVKDRGGETKRIDSIQDAGMAHDQCTIVANTPVSLDGAHSHAAEEAEKGYHDRHASGLPWRKRCHPIEQGPKDPAREGSSENSFPTTTAADLWSHHMVVFQVAPDPLKDVRKLGDQNKKE